MSIATNSLQTYLFRIGTGVIGFLIGILISRLLGPDGKGIYSAIFLYFTIFICLFGNLGSAIVYQITRLQQSPRTTLITASVYSIAIGFLTIFGFYIYSRFASAVQPGAIWLVVAVTPLSLILTNLSGLFQGLNRINVLNWVGVATGLLQLGLLAISYLVSWLTGYAMTINLAILYWAIGQVVAAIIALWVGREFWLVPVRRHFQWPVFLALLSFGWQISMNGVISLLNSRIDSLVVQWLLPVQKYGVYSVAVNGAEILWYASGAIAVAICAQVGTADHEQAGRLTAKAVRHTLLINIPLGAFMWGAAWVIPLIYGNRFTDAMLPYRILLPGVLAYSVAGVFSTYFTNQMGKPMISLVIALVAFLTDLTGSLLLIPQIGMMGAAWANTFSYLISIAVIIVVFCRESRISPVELFKVTQEDLADYRLLGGTVLNFLGRKCRRLK